jgi:hypothetical protein
MPKSIGSSSASRKAQPSKPALALVKSNGSAKKPAVARISVSLEAAIAKKVRELASSEQTSDSTVVEIALMQFFNSGSPAILRAVLERLGVPPRRKES